MTGRLAGLFLLLAVGRVAGGQIDRPEADRTCADSTIVRTYSHCCLWLGDQKLIRGRPGAIVATEGDFSPAVLSRYVAGGAARGFALRYERNALAGYTTRFLGGAMMFAGSIVVLARRCQDEPCERRIPSSIGGRMLLGGMALSAVSFPFRWIAGREAAQAIGLHNAQLIRGTP